MTALLFCKTHREVYLCVNCTEGVLMTSHNKRSQEVEIVIPSVTVSHNLVGVTVAEVTLWGV